MSASQAHALSAIAFQLAAALDGYEQEVAALLRGPFDPDLYQRVSRRMDEMRLYAASLPSVSVAWVEVMIRHFELLHGLWKGVQDPAADASRLQVLHRDLGDAVQRLSRKCVQLVPAT
jgi:hypothetical protein